MAERRSDKRAVGGAAAAMVFGDFLPKQKVTRSPPRRAKPKPKHLVLAKEENEQPVRRQRSDRAQRAITACSASSPSVSAAGPGCRMIGDLISCSSPSRTAGIASQPGRAATCRSEEHTSELQSPL